MHCRTWPSGFKNVGAWKLPFLDLMLVVEMKFWSHAEIMNNGLLNIETGSLTLNGNVKSNFDRLKNYLPSFNFTLYTVGVTDIISVRASFILLPLISCPTEIGFNNIPG